MDMTCESIRESMLRLPAGRLDANRQAEVREHAARCASCGEYLRGLETDEANLIKLVEGMREQVSNVSARVVAALDADSVPPVSMGRRILARWYGWAACAAVLLVVASLAIYRPRSPDADIADPPRAKTVGAGLTQVGDVKTATMSAPMLGAPPPGCVQLNSNLEGMKLNRPIDRAGLFPMSDDGLLWQYTEGRYFDFEQEGSVVWLRIDEGPRRLAGLRIRHIDDIDFLDEPVECDDLAVWCEIQPPPELALQWYADKVTLFQQLDPNELSDLTPLTALANLEVLYVSRRGRSCLHVNEIAPLSQLERMRVLVLHGFHNLVSIGPFKPDLRYLDLTGAAALVDVTPVAAAESLEYLNLQSCYLVTDIDALAGLTNLRRLELFGCKFSDLSPLGAMRKLKYLGLLGTEISDLSALRNLNGLAELNIGACRNLTDITPIAELNSLTTLEMWSCRQVKDISALASLANLEHLNLRACVGIIDIAPLANLQRLRTLDMYGCKGVADVSALANLRNLWKLGIRGCPAVTDASALSYLAWSGVAIHASAEIEAQLELVREQTVAAWASESSVVVRGRINKTAETLHGDELAQRDVELRVIEGLLGRVERKTVYARIPVELDEELAGGLMEPGDEVILFLTPTDEAGINEVRGAVRHNAAVNLQWIRPLLQPKTP